jgi:hypothetical protein
MRGHFPGAMAIYAFGRQLQEMAGPQSDLDEFLVCTNIVLKRG